MVAVLGMALGTQQISAQNDARIRVSDVGKLAKLTPISDGLYNCEVCSTSGCCAVVNCN